MLDMTVSGARQHLAALVRARARRGHRGRRRRPASRGRPRLTYHVTELGDALFPKAYGALTNELLGYLDDEDASVVDRLFARRRDERIADGRDRLAAQAHARRQGRRAGRRSSTRTATSPPPSASAPAATAWSSTTAPSPPSPAATARPAPARSTSSAPCCPAPPSSASSTWSPATATAPTRCGPPERPRPGAFRRSGCGWCSGRAPGSPCAGRSARPSTTPGA